jgi:hypothetical protein
VHARGAVRVTKRIAQAFDSRRRLWRVAVNAKNDMLSCIPRVADARSAARLVQGLRYGGCALDGDPQAALV